MTRKRRHYLRVDTEWRSKRPASSTPLQGRSCCRHATLPFRVKIRDLHGTTFESYVQLPFIITRMTVFTIDSIASLVHVSINTQMSIMTNDLLNGALRKLTQWCLRKGTHARRQRVGRYLALRQLPPFKDRLGQCAHFLLETELQHVWTD